MMFGDKDILRFLRSLLSLPEGSCGVFVDHRPFKYFKYKLMDIVQNEKEIPVRVFPERRKFKIDGRYVYVVDPESIPRVTCGMQYQTVGKSRHTVMHDDARRYLRTRMRGMHLDRQETEAILS